MELLRSRVIMCHSFATILLLMLYLHRRQLITHTISLLCCGCVWFPHFFAHFSCSPLLHWIGWISLIIVLGYAWVQFMRWLFNMTPILCSSSQILFSTVLFCFVLLHLSLFRLYRFYFHHVFRMIHCIDWCWSFIKHAFSSKRSLFWSFAFDSQFVVWERGIHSFWVRIVVSFVLHCTVVLVWWSGCSLTVMLLICCFLFM